MFKRNPAKGLRYALAVIFIITSFCARKENGEQTKTTSKSDKKSAFSDLFEQSEIVPLIADPGFQLSSLPSIGAVNKNGDFIILDNYWVRQVLAFDHSGKGKAKLGKQGNADGEYQYPDNMFYQEHGSIYYIYDGDLLRVLIFDANFEYSMSFNMPLYLDALAVADDGRIFGYTSGPSSQQGVDRVVYECDKTGRVLRKFCKPWKDYFSLAEYKGGGVAIVENYLYVVTPYELRIRKFDLRGRLINDVVGSSEYYVPPSRPTKRMIEGMRQDIAKWRAYYLKSSHIRQIIQIGNEMIGIIIASPADRSILLNIYDLELNQLVADVVVPDHVDGPHAIYTRGDRLYMLRRMGSYDKDKNPAMVVYKLKRDILTNTENNMR